MTIKLFIGRVMAFLRVCEGRLLESKRPFENALRDIGRANGGYRCISMIGGFTPFRVPRKRDLRLPIRTECPTGGHSKTVSKVFHNLRLTVYSRV